MGGIYLVHVSLLLFLRQTIGNGQFGWTVQQRVFKYGDNLTLICIVGGCCTQKAGWGKWIPDFTTIFIDVQGLDVSPNFKYDAQVVRNGFTLVIRQFNETDLNIPYSCTYGYDFSPKKLLNKALAFEDKVEERSKRGEGSSRAKHYIFVIVLSGLGFCVVVLIVAKLLKWCKSEDDQNRYNTREGMMKKNIGKGNVVRRGSTKWSSHRRGEVLQNGKILVTRQGNVPHIRGSQFPLSRQSSGTSFNFYFNSPRGSATASSSKCSIYVRGGSDLSDIDLYVDETDEEDHIPISVQMPSADYRTGRTSIRIMNNDTGDLSTSKKNSTIETLV